MNFLKSLVRISKSVILVLLVSLIVAFCLNNSAHVAISLWPFPFEAEARIFVLVVISFLAGFLLASLVGGISIARIKTAHFFAKHKIEKLEKMLKGEK